MRAEPDKGTIEWAYKVLGISAYCNETEGRRAYRLRVLAFHPDRATANGIDPLIAEELTKDVNQAWSVVRNSYRVSGSGYHYGHLPPPTWNRAVPFSNPDRLPPMPDYVRKNFWTQPIGDSTVAIAIPVVMIFIALVLSWFQ